MIAVRPTPLLAAIADRPLAATDTVQLLAAQAELADETNLAVTLLWQATGQPEHDYSVFVHVSDQAQILGPDDLIAQGDRRHPAAGFYPTSGWQPGELVQDNYLIPLPANRLPRTVVVGLYTVDENGRFTNYLSYSLAAVVGIP
ncbi:MAG: hypothetical protein IPM39_11485 [Chloroflexi bacterium]|nr:hypothetical protein [Chloroflexota bacterium]